MRKILLLTASALILFSCSKQDVSDFSIENEEITIFHASMESAPVSDTKVYSNDQLKLRWNADDRISLFEKKSRNKEFKFLGEEGASSGEFEKVSFIFGSGNPVPHNYAVYPYSSFTSILDLSPYSITLKLPSEQTFKEGSFGLGANTMVAVSDDDFLNFKNVCGFLRFRFWGNNVKVKSVKLEGNNSEKLAGEATVIADLDKNPAVTMNGSATGSIILNCTEPVALGTSSDSPTAFILVVPPTNFSKGVKVTVVDELGRVYERVITSTFTINRTGMKSFPAIEVNPS